MRYQNGNTNNAYLNREITKTKFAEILGISTTTLNRLIMQWERKRE